MSGGIKGYPSSQKLVKGVPSAFPEFATLQPQDENLRAAIDTAVRFAFRVGSDTVPRTAGAGTGNGSAGLATIVADAATPAKVGDFVRFIDGNSAYLEVPIISVDTNAFMLGARLPNPPQSGDQFFIMRYATQRVDADGAQIVTVTQGPVRFVLDGIDTEVEEDTGTPANSIPLPVKVLDASGLVPDFATETTLLDVDSKLTTLNAKDFATQTTLAALNGKFGSLGQKNMAGSAPVVIASDQSTLPVSAASLPLPAGAATEVTLSALNGKFNSLGQKTMANSAPVVISSDQSAIPASQSGTWNITNITGTVSLPTGASTSALQTTGNTSLSNIDTKLPANLGQKASSASLAVVLASDQSAIKQAANTAGNSPGSGSVSTVTTLNAPANAVGFILMNLDTSSTNLRYRIGATATTTSGQQLQPGRDTGYIPCAANISIVAESGTVAYDIQWVLSQ